MQITANCGCVLDCWVTDDSWGGCCCGDCYNSWGTEYTVEDLTMVKPCTNHGG